MVDAGALESTTLEQQEYMDHAHQYRYGSLTAVVIISTNLSMVCANFSRFNVISTVY